MGAHARDLSQPLTILRSKCARACQREGDRDRDKGGF